MVNKYFLLFFSLLRLYSYTVLQQARWGRCVSDWNANFFFSLKIIEPTIFLDGKKRCFRVKIQVSIKNKLTKNKTILEFILKAAKYPVIISNVCFFWGGKHPSESLAGHTRLVLIIKLSPSATGINITVMFVVTLRLRIFFFLSLFFGMLGVVFIIDSL